MIRFVLADLRRLWAGSVVIVLLVALAVALGVTVTLQERALRLGSARAADRFDLVVGAAGSDTQLVLSAVFLQIAPLPLVSGDVLRRLTDDPHVAWAAPIGFGDSFDGLPIVGTTQAMVTDGDTRSLREGRSFAALDEAVVGAAANLPLGRVIKPLHGLPGEGGHVHPGPAFTYTVVGRLPPTGTPWDRAILVPIEAVWRLHGLYGGTRSADQAAPKTADVDLAAPLRLGPPWGADLPGVPAILVKPKSVIAAYKLRVAYRTAATLGVFPAEVLTRLYATLGDARFVLASVAAGAQALVAAAIALVGLVHVVQRRRQIGALRALGTPRVVLFGIVWLEMFILAGLGLLLGLGLGYAAARLLAGLLEARSGVVLPVGFALGDLAGILALLAGMAVLAGIPALFGYRQPVSAALRA